MQPESSKDPGGISIQKLKEALRHTEAYRIVCIIQLYKLKGFEFWVNTLHV